MVLQDVIYEGCRDFAKCPSRGQWIIAYGENGTGKSTVAKGVARWANRMAVHLPLVVDDQGVRLATCQYVHWPKLMYEMKNGAWDIIDGILPADLLILDDVGGEQDPSRIAVERLYLVLEERVNRWTMITTNFGPDNWETRFERRIASRFLRNSRHVALDQVPDWNSR